MTFGERIVFLLAGAAAVAAVAGQVMQIHALTLFAFMVLVAVAVAVLGLAHRDIRRIEKRLNDKETPDDH